MNPDDILPPIDPFEDVAEGEAKQDFKWDWKKYEKWREEDEKVLIRCLIDRPGTTGCKYYETIRRRMY